LPDAAPADREAIIRAFLTAHGWNPAHRTPLAGDASFRRYERLRRGDDAVLLMDAPPPKEDVRPFARLARHLKALGFSAPAILAEDAAAGLLLIEDFGDATFTRILAGGGDERAFTRWPSTSWSTFTGWSPGPPCRRDFDPTMTRPCSPRRSC